MRKPKKGLCVWLQPRLCLSVLWVRLCSRGEGWTAVMLHFYRAHIHTHTHTKPVVKRRMTDTSLGLGPSPTSATPNAPLHHTEYTPWQLNICFPRLSFEKFTLVLRQHKHTHFFPAPTYCWDLPTCEHQSAHTCTVVATFKYRKGGVPCTVFWVFSSNLNAHAFIMSSSKATEMAAFPVVLLGIFLSLLYRFEKMMIMTWQHFMTVFPSWQSPEQRTGRDNSVNHHTQLEFL